MRIRVLGHYVHLQIAVLAAAEASIFFAMLLAAVFLRFPEDFPNIAQIEGTLSPRAVLFSAAMMVSLLAFGLYSSRQRAQTTGLIIRLVAAVVVGAAIAALSLY